MRTTTTSISRSTTSPSNAERLGGGAPLHRPRDERSLLLLAVTLLVGTLAVVVAALAVLPLGAGSGLALLGLRLRRSDPVARGDARSERAALQALRDARGERVGDLLLRLAGVARMRDGAHALAEAVLRIRVGAPELVEGGRAHRGLQRLAELRRVDLAGRRRRRLLCERVRRAVDRDRAHEDGLHLAGLLPAAVDGELDAGDGVR